MISDLLYTIGFLNKMFFHFETIYPFIYFVFFHLFLSMGFLNKKFICF